MRKTVKLGLSAALALAVSAAAGLAGDIKIEPLSEQARDGFGGVFVWAVQFPLAHGPAGRFQHVF